MARLFDKIIIAGVSDAHRKLVLNTQYKLRVMVWHGIDNGQVIGPHIVQNCVRPNYILCQVHAYIQILIS